MHPRTSRSSALPFNRPTALLLALAIASTMGCHKSSGGDVGAQDGGPKLASSKDAASASADGAPTSDGAARVPKGCSADGWCEVMKVRKGNLFGIWGIDSHDLYAIWGGVLVHEQDLEWHIVPTGGQRIFAVMGTGHKDVWAVGALGCLWHLTDRWRASKSDNKNDLHGVAALPSGTVWAVGDGGTILRFDGTEWKSTPSGTTQNLIGVWADPSGDAWAVGQNGTALHWVNGAWTAAKTPTQAPIGALWGSAPNDIWAVGGVGTLLHYNGKTWSGGVPATNKDLYGLWGNGSTDVWAVGDGGTILHWDGNLWSSSPSGTEDDLHGIWGMESRDMWAVGFSRSTGETSTLRRHR